MNVDFMIANQEDIKGIVDLCNEVFEENTSYQKAEELFAKSMSDPNQIYIVGKLDGKIVAHTKVGIINTMFASMECYGILNHVCVKAEYRKHKIASQMLEYVKKICQERECYELKLWSKNFRVAAHAFYHSAGFNTIDAKFFELNIKENNNENN